MLLATGFTAPPLTTRNTNHTILGQPVICHCSCPVAAAGRSVCRSRAVVVARHNNTPTAAKPRTAAAASSSARRSSAAETMPAADNTGTAAAPVSGPAAWRRPYTPGPLTEAEFNQYWDDGYVIKEDLLTKDDIKPCFAAIERRVDDVAQRLLSAGLITDAAEGADVFTRLALLEKQFKEASVLVHKDGRLPPEFAALWTHPKLIDINRQLLGPDIGGHPSWNLRAKSPRQEAANVPWHQDSAYCHPESWTTLQVTAWVPLLDVNVENGCMQLLAGGHRTGRTAKHTGAVGDTWYLRMDEAAAESELGVDFTRDLVTAEMRVGSVLLLNNLIPHRSLDNTSSVVRWSLDLRWQHPDLPDGAFGLKRPIVMSRGEQDTTQQQQQQTDGTAAQPKQHHIDWTGWADVDKKSGSTEGLTAVDQVAGADPELSTILVGGWLDLWPLTHTNKHTEAWEAFKRAQDQKQEQ